MECKKCGKPTVEGATFCGYCGSRVDGKIPCNACGRLNDENFAFCTACGNRLDGKTVCKSCGTAYEGNFCPACGERGQVCAERKKSSKSSTKKGEATLFKRICQIVSGGAAMCGVLFALIFVFFVGIKEVLVAGGKETVAWQKIYYFFGDFYKDMDAIDLGQAGATTWFVDLVETWGTTAGVLGTVLVCALLIAVVAFAAVAIVKYVRSWVRKQEDASFGWALASALSFLVGATLFYEYNREVAQTKGINLGVISGTSEISTYYNGATSTAIVLIGIFVGIAIVCRILSAGKGIWTRKNLGKIVCSFVGLTFACLILGLVRGAGLGFSLTINSNEASLSSGYMNFALAIDVALATVVNKELAGYERITDLLSVMNVYALLAQLLLFAVAVFAVTSIHKNACGVNGGKKSGLLWSILTTVSSVLLLVFHILMANAFTDAYLTAVKNTAGTVTTTSIYLIEVSYAMPICLIVFSVLLLAGSIVRCVFQKKSEKAE